MSLDWESIEFEYIDEFIMKENQVNSSENITPESTLSTLDDMDVDDFLSEDIDNILTDDIDTLIDNSLFNGTFDSTINFKGPSKIKAKKEILRNYKCEVCNVKLPSLAYLKRHYKTKGHQRKLGLGTVQSENSPRVEKLTELTSDEIELLDMFDKQITQVHGDIKSPEGKIVRFDPNDLETAFLNSEVILSFNLTSDPAQLVTFPIKTAPIKPTSPFFCQLCNKSFSQQCYYTQHNKTHHSGDKPFKCEKCGKKFSSEFEKMSHMTKHSDLKPFRCHECSRSYNNKVDLRRHEKNHDLKKPFPCEICSRGFVRRDHLEKHYKVHDRKGKKNLMKMTGLVL